MTQCEVCGSDAEYYTDVDNPDGYVNDGDKIKCLECDAVGYWSADNTSVWDNWSVWDNSSNNKEDK